MKIKKAIFPVGGLGTRFLPATKACPKEMLTLVDKPLIQYAVEEAVSAGIEEIIFITSIHKRSIEDHFDNNYELEDTLFKKGKHEILNIVKEIAPKNLQCIYIRQKEPLGLGHAVLCAKRLFKDEYFAIILADDLIYNNKKSCLMQMMEVHERYNSGVIAVQEVPLHTVNQYGIVNVHKNNSISSLVEKPKPEETESNLAVVGRYILHSNIFDYLEKQEPGSGGEIQLTDAIQSSLECSTIFSHSFYGTRYDCGDKLGFMIANYEYSIRHPILGNEFKKYLELNCSKEAVDIG